jgi:hypothetical protein
MPNYQKGQIYCLRSHQTDLVYIGSTLNPLYKRKGQHKSNYKIWLKGEHNYVSSYEIIKYDDAYIELVEDYPCNTRAELERREGQIIRETENCCNRFIAGRTYAEYCQDNKEKINKKSAKWYQANKEQVAKQHAKYRQANKEKISEYRQVNKEKISVRMAKYRQANKEQIAEYHAKKVKCDCGSEVRRDSLPRHRRSKKHQNYLLTLNQD